MGFKDHLGPLVNVEGATLISTILLVDVDVKSFSPYKCVTTPWAKHTKTIVRGAPNLGNLSCSKLDFSPLSLAVAATLPCPAILSSATSKAACHVPADLQRGCIRSSLCSRQSAIYWSTITWCLANYTCWPHPSQNCTHAAESLEEHVLSMSWFTCWIAVNANLLLSMCAAADT